MELKEVAKQFNHTVNSFAQALGYSRQTLYQMGEGPNVCTPRYYAAMKLLKYESDKMYEEDVKAAELRRVDREKSIAEMCKNVGAINVIESEERLDWKKI